MKNPLAIAGLVVGIIIIIMLARIYSAVDEPRKEREAAIKAENQRQFDIIYEQAKQMRHDHLMDVWQDYDRQYKITHSSPLVSSNDAAQLWNQYLAARATAGSELQSTNFMVGPWPQTPYLDAETNLGVFTNQ